MQVLEINDRYSKNLKKVLAAWEAENLEEPEEEYEQEHRSQAEAVSSSRPPASQQPSATSQSEASSDVPADSRSAPQQSNSLSDWVLNSERGTGANALAAVDQNGDQP